MNEKRDFLHLMLDMLTGAYNREDVRNNAHGHPLETNIGKLFAIFAWGLEMTYEQVEKVQDWTDIDKAQGVVLDRFGANYGVARDGLPDDFYRLLIKVKRIAQLSGGDIETVIAAAATLLDVELTDIGLEEVFPAKVYVSVDEALLSAQTQNVIDAVAAMIHRIVAAGVGFRLILRSYREYRERLVLNTGLVVVKEVLLEPVSLPRSLSGEVRPNTSMYQQAEIMLQPA